MPVRREEYVQKRFYKIYDFVRIAHCDVFHASGIHGFDDDDELFHFVEKGDLTGSPVIAGLHRIRIQVRNVQRRG